MKDASSKSEESSKARETEYRIVHVEDGKTVTECRFKASGNDEALKVLAKYREEHCDGKEHYLKYSHMHVAFSNGEEKCFDTVEEMLDDYRKRIGKVKLFFRHFCYKWSMRWTDFTFFWKNLLCWLKTKHSLEESWGVDDHVLEDLLFNVRKLLKDNVGVSSYFYGLARKKIHEGEQGFDLDAYNAEHHETTPEEDKVALELCKAAYNDLIEKILLYRYYESYGHVNTQEEGMAEIAAKYKDTIPYKEGFYDSIDYLKLDEIQNAVWDSIWDWMKEYGRTLWD